MKDIVKQYQRQIKECDDALNSKQLDKKQTSWYKDVRKEAIKRIEFHS